MPLHPQAAAFLEIWNRVNATPMETLPVTETRGVLAASAGPLSNPPRLAGIADLTIDTPAGPLRVRLYQPAEPATRGVCLYFHGGGWALNSVDTHDDLVRRLCAAAGCTMVSVDYRLAPEHPYPAAVEDAYSALQWVREWAPEWNVDHERIAVAGDSAGANLAAAVTLVTRDRGGPSIRQQVLVYPITDADFTRASYIENADGYFLTTGQMRWFWEMYCPDESRRSESYASPLRAPSLRGLPPALILTAEYDPLRDEGEAYADALHEAGVAAALHRYPGMIHAFLRRADTFDDSRAAIREIGDTLRIALRS